MSRHKLTHCVNGHELTGDNVRLKIKSNRTYQACRHCLRDYEKRYWEKNPERLKIKKARCAKRNKRSQFIKRYEITPEEKHDILITQGYCCATCRANAPQGPMGAGHGQWHLDHNHNTGVVRGVLCARCNLILTENMTPEILDSLANYLRFA